MKNNLYDNIVSDNNIFLAIHSLKSYIFEKELLKNNNHDENIKLSNYKVFQSDLELYYSLSDNFDHEVISKVINTVKKILVEIINTEKLFDIEVYFRPKKLDNKDKISRPLHTTSILNQIAIVSILNQLIYCFGDNLDLSDLTSIIPSNFFGNIPTKMPNKLYEKWLNQYRAYTDSITRSYETYCKTGEFNYEITLDIVNFFPSINPYIIYKKILDLLKIKYNTKEQDTLKKALFKLLYFNVTNVSTTDSRYYTVPSECNYSIGITQGLPQSYFFANLLMVDISKIFESGLSCKSFYYVDDSVIFANKNDRSKILFPKYINDINTKLEVLSTVNNYELLNKLEVSSKIIVFSQKQKYTIQVHSEETKSIIQEIKKFKEGQKYLNRLSRNASMALFDLNSSFTEDDDKSLLNKYKAILKSIINEINLPIDTNYRKLLIRFKKFFEFRILRIHFRFNNEINDQHLEEIISVFERYKSNDDFEGLKSFFSDFDESIFINKMRFYLANSINENFRNKCLLAILKFNDYFYSDFDDRERNSYFIKILDSYNVNQNIIFNIHRKYKSIDRITKLNFPLHSRSSGNLTDVNINKIFLDSNYKNYRKRYLQDYMLTAAKYTGEFDRMITNSILSRILNVECNDDLQIVRNDQRLLRSNHFRLLCFIRNSKFNRNDFKKIFEDQQNNDSTIDYDLFEVVYYFRKFLKDPQLIDNLICVHLYTVGLWKNGSKFLYFYTLHNHEHAIALIKYSTKILKAIDYFQISNLDYYILFLSCYLHDISMVLHPDLRFLFLEGNHEEFDTLTTDSKYNLLKIDFNIHNKELKIILLDIYNKIDSAFENVIRSMHSHESAKFIRSTFDLSFIDSTIKDIVAEVSEAHGQQLNEIYSRKSWAKKTLLSKKYIKILLRISDCLDITRDRVTNPIIANNLKHMTNDSKFHWLSHQIIDSFDIETDYKLTDLITDSYLSRQTITERIIINIHLNSKTLISCESKKCAKFHCKLNDEKPDEFSVIISDSESEICNDDICNFMCRWMAKKNYFLYEELFALQKYLNTLSDNQFKSEFVIRYYFKSNKIISNQDYNQINNYLF